MLMLHDKLGLETPLVRERSRVQSSPTAPFFPFKSKALRRGMMADGGGTLHEHAPDCARKLCHTRATVRAVFS